MKCYTNTGTKNTIMRCAELDIGLMIVSPRWVNPDRWPFYAIDNGAYASWKSGKDFRSEPFLKILNRTLEYERRPDFAVLPDIVAGGKGSLDFSMEWRDKFINDGRYRYIPFYLAVQDGMTFSEVDKVLDSEKIIAGIFVGGTMDWKLRTAEDWCDLADRYEIGCHIGRIGPVNRIVWADRIGASSIDSTTWVQRNGAIEYVCRARKQTILKEVV